MAIDVFGEQISKLVMAVLKDKPCTLATLKEETHLHEVSVTIAIRNLQNAGIVEHGYLMDDGDWLEDWFPDADEYQRFPIDAWRICK